MHDRATGRFDVKLEPQATDDAAGSTVSRLALDKRYHGDREATGRGEMLAARTAVPESAGYVAIERVSGTLAGRAGSFVLQHSGTMSKQAQQLTIRVVPDSGTDQLVGLRGEMGIRIEDGDHYYEFEYRLTSDV